MLESLDQEIRILRAHYWSARDPEGRGFAPLAEAYRLQGEIEEAASLVQDGLERLPGFVAGYLVASRIARDQGDLLGSRELLDRALDLDPENVVARFERAALALEERDREGAHSDLRTVLDLDPLHREAAHLLEQIESGSELEAHATDAPAPVEPEEPVESVEPSLTAEIRAAAEPVSDPAEGADDGPDRSLFTRTMGDLYAAQGFLERAVEVYRHLSAADPADGELRERLEELSSRAEVEAGGVEEPAPRAARLGRGPILSADEDEGPLVEIPIAGGVDRGIRSYFTDLLAWVPGAVPISSLAPDDLVEVESPVPVEALAPGAATFGLSEADIVVDNPYPELGIPIPIALLAPDSEEVPSHPEDFR